MIQFLQYAINAVGLGSLYALFALAVALIFGVGRIANFASGDLLTIAGYSVVVAASVSWPIATFIAIGAAVVVALLMERFAFRPVRNAPMTTLLIVSFALSALIQNILLLTFGDLPRTTSFGVSLVSPIHLGRITVTGINLLVIAVTLVIVVALSLMLKHTLMGVKLRAAAEDFEMSRLLGVRANVVMATVFAISGALAGIAGLFLTIQVGTITPTFGVTPVTVAFVAAIIGGLGSLVGATLGGFLVGVLTVVLQVVLPSQLQTYRDAFVFGGVIVLLMVRPQGLLSAPTGERI